MSKSEEYYRSRANSVIEWASEHGNESVSGGSRNGLPDVMAQHRCAPRITDDYNIPEDDTDSDVDATNGKASMGSMRLARVDEEVVRRSKKKNPPSSKGGSSRQRMAEVVVITTLVGIIAAASLAIGYTVVKHRLDSPHPIEGGTGGNDGGESQEQKFLEIAERVIMACGEEALDQDRTGCQKICLSRMCCFESGEYSCEEDEGRYCAVYAGCEALVGFPAEMNEE